MSHLGESKTLIFWLALVGAAFAILLITAGLQQVGVEVPYVSDLLTLMGIGGSAGTTRNVISDGGPKIVAAYRNGKAPVTGAASEQTFMSPLPAQPTNTLPSLDVQEEP